jgi:hypothetical protein
MLIAADPLQRVVSTTASDREEIEMDFVEALRALWRRRALVALAGVMAVFAGLAAGYEVGVVPPSVKARSVEYGTGSAKVLVDTTPTTLTDSGFDYEPLTTRANVYAQLFSTSTVRRYIARLSGIPSQRIVTEVPSNGRLLTNQPGASSVDEPSERAAQIGSEGQSYRIDVSVESDLPIISIVAQAPTEAEALRLVNGATDGIESYIRSLRPTDPEGRRVRVRGLGDAAGSTVGGQTGQLVAVLVTLGLFLAAAVLIVTFSGVASKWRQKDDDEPPPTAAPAPAEAPPPAEPPPAEASTRTDPVEAGR